MAAELNQPRYELMEVLVSARAASAAAADSQQQRPAAVTDDDNGYGINRSVNGGGGVIMEGILEKSLYDIGDPDLMDVWDTDLNPVSKERGRERRFLVVTSRLSRE